MATEQVTFGLKTSQVNTSYAEILALWQEADAIPAFADAWLWDHMLPLRGPITGTALEAWTLLAALAARTERLRLGVIVTSNRLRPPAVLAKMAATVDQISGGRLVFGIGAGGSAVADPAALALVRREFDAYGIEVVTPGEAIGALGEAVTIIRRLWARDEPFDFEGRYYRLRGAIGEPKPVQRPGPPMLIAAAGDRGLTIVAEHADMWVWPGDLEGFRVASRKLDERCDAIGRDPAAIRRTVQMIVRGSDPSTVVAVRDAIMGFIAAGASHFVLGPVPPYPGTAARWLADEVVEPVLARLH